MLLQRGLRLNAQAQKIWIELFRLELLYAAKIRERNAVLGIDNDADVDNDDDNNNDTDGDQKKAAAADDNDNNDTDATSSSSKRKRAAKTRGVYDSESESSGNDDADAEDDDDELAIDGQKLSKSRKVDGGRKRASTAASTKPSTTEQRRAARAAFLEGAVAGVVLRNAVEGNETKVLHRRQFCMRLYCYLLCLS